MTTVAVYGSVNWDEICQLPRYPREHEKLEALAIDSALGGSAANTSTWLAPLIERVELIGAVGGDHEGSLCLEWLDDTGVSRTCVEVIEGAHTSRGCCWVVGSDKRIVTMRQPGLRREHAPEAALAVVAGADHLHLGSTIDTAGFDCVGTARRANRTISVELSSNTHDAIRPHADVVFLNTEELRHGFGIDPDELGPDAVTRVAQAGRDPGDHRRAPLDHLRDHRGSGAVPGHAARAGRRSYRWR